MSSKFVKCIKEYDDFMAIGGVDNSVIEQVEQAMGLKFADDYRDYLKECGQAIVDGHEFTGIHKSERLNVEKVTQKARKQFQDIASDWYVIEDLGIDRILVWQSSSGTVYESNDHGITEEVSKSLFEYMKL